MDWICEVSSCGHEAMICPGSREQSPYNLLSQNKIPASYCPPRPVRYHTFRDSRMSARICLVY